MKSRMGGSGALADSAPLVADLAAARRQIGLATLERRCKRTAVEGQHARHVEHQAACDAVPEEDQ